MFLENGGVSGVGTVFMLTRFFDGLTDPVFGVLGDRLRRCIHHVELPTGSGSSGACSGKTDRGLSSYKQAGCPILHTLRANTNDDLTLDAAGRNALDRSTRVLEVVHLRVGQVELSSGPVSNQLVVRGTDLFMGEADRHRSHE